MTKNFILQLSEEKKQREQEEKRRRLEESEKKRQAMMQAMKDQASKKGPNFTITKKDIGVSIFILFIINHQNTSKINYYILLRAPSRRRNSSATRRRSNSRRRKRSRWASASSHWRSRVLALTSSGQRPVPCGSKSSNSRRRSTTLRSAKNARTMMWVKNCFLFLVIF